MISGYFWRYSMFIPQLRFLASNWCGSVEPYWCFGNTTLPRKVWVIHWSDCAYIWYPLYVCMLIGWGVYSGLFRCEFSIIFILLCFRYGQWGPALRLIKIQSKYFCLCVSYSVLVKFKFRQPERTFLRWHSLSFVVWWLLLLLLLLVKTGWWCWHTLAVVMLLLWLLSID